MADQRELAAVAKLSRLDQRKLHTDIRQLTKKANGLLSQMHQQLQRLREKNQQAVDDARTIRVQLAGSGVAQEAAASSAQQEEGQEQGRVQQVQSQMQPGSGATCAGGSAGAAQPNSVQEAAEQCRLAEEMLLRSCQVYGLSSTPETAALLAKLAEARNAITQAAAVGDAGAITSAAGSQYSLGASTSSSGGGSLPNGDAATTPSSSSSMSRGTEAGSSTNAVVSEDAAGNSAGGGSSLSSGGEAGDEPPAGQAGVGEQAGEEEGMVVSKEVAMMSPYIQREVVQNGLGLPGNAPVKLPKQVTPTAWEMIQEYCSFHSVPGRSDKERRTFDERFIRRDSAQLCDLTSAADGLEMRALVDLASRAIARLIEGRSAEEIREAFRLPDDLSEEEKLEPIATPLGGMPDPRVRMLNRLYAKRRKELEEKKRQLQAEVQQVQQGALALAGYSAADASEAASSGSVAAAGQAAGGHAQQQQRQQQDERSLEELLDFIEAGSGNSASGSKAGSKKQKKKGKQQAGQQQAAAQPPPPPKQQQQQHQEQQEQEHQHTGAGGVQAAAASQQVDAGEPQGTGAASQHGSQQEQQQPQQQVAPAPEVQAQLLQAATTGPGQASFSSCRAQIEQREDGAAGAGKALPQQQPQQQQEAVAAASAAQKQPSAASLLLPQRTSKRQRAAKAQEQEQLFALARQVTAQEPAEEPAVPSQQPVQQQGAQQQGAQQQGAQQQGAQQQAHQQQASQAELEAELQQQLLLNSAWLSSAGLAATGPTLSSLPPSCSRYLLPPCAMELAPPGVGLKADPLPSPNGSTEPGLAAVAAAAAADPGLWATGCRGGSLGLGPDSGAGTNPYAARAALTYRPVSVLTSLANFRGATHVRRMPPQPNPSGKKPPLPQQQQRPLTAVASAVLVQPGENGVGSSCTASSNGGSGRSSGAATPAKAQGAAEPAQLGMLLAAALPHAALQAPQPQQPATQGCAEALCNGALDSPSSPFKQEGASSANSGNSSTSASLELPAPCEPEAVPVGVSTQPWAQAAEVPPGAGSNQQQLSPADIGAVSNLLSSFLRSLGLEQQLQVVAACHGSQQAIPASMETVTAAAALPCGARLELQWVPPTEPRM